MSFFSFVSFLPLAEAEEGNGWLNRYTFSDVGSYSFYGSPQVFLNGSTYESLELVENPSFASVGDCRYFVRNSHCAVEFCDTYVKLWDPDYTKVAVYSEQWTVEYWDGDEWLDTGVGFQTPSWDVVETDDCINVTRIHSLVNVGSLNVTYIFRVGHYMKHTVVFESLRNQVREYRVVQALAGITDNKVETSEEEEFTVTEPYNSTANYFRVGAYGNASLIQDMTRVEESKLLWITFDVHSEGCKADIYIGNYTLSQYEKLYIDPASSTFYESEHEMTGYVSNSHADYSTCHDAATGSVVDASELNFGQWISSDYYVYRSYLHFNTSILSGETLESAELYMYLWDVSDDYDLTDDTIRLANWTEASDGLSTADFDAFGASYYDDNTTIPESTEGDVWMKWNITDTDIVNTDGNTSICVRTQKDISSIAPTGTEVITVLQQTWTYLVVYTEVGDDEEVYVDRTSDVDSDADVGSHSSFIAQQYIGGATDTLTEAQKPTEATFSEWLDVDSFTGDMVEWDTEQGASPYLNASDYPTNYIHEAKSASMEEGYFGFENTSYSNIYAASFNVSAYCIGDDGDDGFDVYYTYDGGSPTSLGTIVCDTSWAWQNLTATESLDIDEINTLQVYLDTDNGGGGDDRYVDHMKVGINGTFATYKLELEEQFIEVPASADNEELCVYTGAFSDSEDLMVQVWNSSGSSWHWVMNLTASQWNNASVSDYLTSAYNFTIRFVDGNQTSDDNAQSTWIKDCTLLHLWNVTGNEEDFYGDITSQVTIGSAKLVGFQRYVEVAPQLTVASTVAKSVTEYAYVSATQVSTINSAKTVSVQRYHSISPQYSLFSSDAWSFSRYGAVYEILSFDGWLEFLQLLEVSGSVAPLLVLDSSMEWGVIRYGDVEVVCQIEESRSSAFELYVSVNPVFVIVGNYSEEAETIENIYGVIGQLLGVNCFNLYVFERAGDITETIAVATTKDVSLEELVTILSQMGVDGVSFKSLVRNVSVTEQFNVTSATLSSLIRYGFISKSITVGSTTFKTLARAGAINQDFTIDSLTLHDLLLLGYIDTQITIDGSTQTELQRAGIINETFTIDGTYSTFEELMLSGSINLDLTITDEVLATLIRTGLINENFTINNLTLKDLIELGIINADATIDHETLMELMKAGIIPEAILIDKQKNVAFSLFTSVGETFTIESIIEAFSGVLKWFYGAINQLISIDTLQNFMAPYGTGQDIFVRGKGIFFIAAAIAMAGLGLILMRRKENNNGL